MKKCKVVVLLIMIVCIMMTTTACSALDGVLTFGEDAFDSIFGAIDKGPLGKLYDWLNIEGLITGEHGGNFENPDDNPDDVPDTTVKVESIAVDYSGAKTVFKFAEKFSIEGLKVTATMSDGTTKEISLTDIQVKEPDTTTPGVRVVMVTYEGKSARYEVTINEREIPAISGDALVNIEKENENAPYRVEAELIDMAISGVVKADGVESFVATAPEGTELISGNKYLTGYGVKWNYFGFTFTAAQEYKDVTIVLRVANPNAKDIDASVVKAMLNYDVELSLEGHIIEANSGWSDIIIRNLTIPAGTNTLTFDVLEDNTFDLDYVDLYVGMHYINSVVEIKDSNTVIRDLETLDTEKAFTRSDVAELHGLKDGQLFVEPVKKEWPGGLPTSGGTSVGAVGKGSLISTTLRLSEDATVRILFKASKTTKENSIYYVDDHWNFYIDGVKLQFVEYVDIHGGDRSQAMYWEWKYTNLGEINLSAGDHSFVIEAVGTDCNVDTIEFEIISFGSYDEIGKDLSEQKHTCDDICPTCGKCTTKCDEDACADKCDGCRPEYDLIIGEDGRYYIEAENLPLDDLVAESAAGIKVESFTGGQGIGGIKSGYQTFTIKSDKDVTVRFSVNFAKKAGGSILTYIPSVTVNGNNITLSDGTIPNGVDGNQYWNLVELALAEIELKAGVKYEFCVNLKSGNLDKYIFEVIEGGGQGVTDERVDVTLEETGTTKYELENINASQCDIITRQDFVNLGVCAQGDVGRGEGRIYGFEDGSVFRVYVKVNGACTINISIAGFADTGKEGNPILAAHTWKFGDIVITPADDAAINTNGTVGEALVGTVEITEAGIYVFEFDFGKRTDLDYLAFEVVDGNVEHQHTEETLGRVEPTCTTTGLTEGKKCSSCGEILVAQEEIPALGHDTVTDEAVAPTCTTIGKTEGSHCTRCDGATVAQEEIPALGHDIVIDKAVEATCTTPGKTEGSHCSRCDGATVAQQEIPAGHKNENGDYICDSCGANLCTEHNIVTDKAVAATCTATGLSEGSHCSTCNTILVAQEEIPALGHDIVIDKAVEATCTTPGKTEGSHCSRCDGATVAQEDTALKPHTYTAEYTLEGVKTYYAVGETFDTYALVAKLDCAKCDHVEVVTDYTVSNTAPLKVDDTSVTISWIRNEVEYSEEITIYVFDVDAVILGGTTNVEAENLPLNYLNKQTAEGVKIESFNVNGISGKSIGNLKGGYQIFTVVSDKDVTVQLAVSFAKKQGGKILSYIPAISVNGQYLTLTDGDVPVGVSGNQYFNFAELGLATIELKAGVKYEFCVNLKSGNLDKYILKVVDGDGQQVPDKYTDVTVSSNGTSKFEFETINPDKCDINTRADFISAGQCAAGDVGRGNGTIYGFNNGSIFRVYVNVTEAGLYKISIAGKGNVAKGANINLSAYSWKFGDTVITPAASAKIPDGSIGEAVIGTVEITEPGIYVFEFTFGIQTDLDYLAFEMHEHSEQILSSVAPTCTATGLTEGKICSSCGMVFVAQETVDALGHNIVTDAAVEPTCTTDGKTEGSHCTRCDGATVAQDVIPAAHKDENGDYICDSCGSNLCTEHNIVTDKAVAATCTTPGKTEGSHCSNCNMVLVAQNEVPALGHSYNFIVEGAKTDYLVGESFDTANLVAKLDCMACDHIEEVSDYALSVSGALKNSDESVTVSCVRNGLTYSENIAIMVVDARISGSDVSIEAETLLTNLLTPDSTAGVKIESFNVGGNSGKSLGGLKGGYQIFTVVSDNDVTVQLNVMFAKKAGGKILSYIPAISVNGQYLTLTNGDVPAGVSGNQYFNFGELGLAKIELKAGVKYEFCVNLKSGNLDKYILKVVDGEGQQVPDKYTDVTVATSGVTKYQLENINPDKCDINTRADFVSARQCAAGDVGRGSGTIYGFNNGSVFRVYVNVTEACTLNISIAGKGNVSKGANLSLSAYSWQFGDTVITPAEDAAILDGTIGEATVGTVEITEAGIYVFEFTFGIQTDLDYVSFEVVE